MTYILWIKIIYAITCIMCCFSTLLCRFLFLCFYAPPLQYQNILTCIYVFLKFFIVIQLQLSAFSPHPSTPPQPNHLPPPPPPSPLILSCVLYSSSCNPLSALSPPHSPLDIVTLFLISMSLVIFCLLLSFVDYVFNGNLCQPLFSKVLL